MTARSESAGALRSTLFPPMGPAVAQFPAASHTRRVPVDAFASSTPAGTDVDNVKAASLAFARPDPLSRAAQPIETFAPCHTPFATPHVIVGGCESRGGRSLMVIVQVLVWPAAIVLEQSGEKAVIA